jgi:hypothetical protein
MANIWMRLDSIATDELMDKVVVPMIRALGGHGAYANLKPTRNSIFNNEGDLAYALFPGGELGFFFTTGPTLNTITGATDNDRYLMATVSGVPGDTGLTDADIDQALRDFESGLFEREIYNASSRLTEGGSIKGSTKTERFTATSATHDSVIPPSEATPSPKPGCYIATAVYGGYDTPQVRVLRRFRDQSLGTHSAGRWFIGWYYRISPALVRRFGERSWFTACLRPGLDVLTGVLRRSGVADDPYIDARR